MRRILIVLTSGLLLLTACSGSTVVGQVTTTGFATNEGAPAPATGGGQSTDSDIDAPASSEPAIEPAVRAAAVRLEEDESVELDAPESVFITEQVWCAGLGPGIQHAGQMAIDVRYTNPDGLADAVEALHEFYRAAAEGRPAGISTHVAWINAALDELEPVLRPVGWNYGQIDRSVIADADRSYTDAAMAIGQYNTDVCGLEPTGLPDDPEIEIEESVLQDIPEPRNPDAPFTDIDIEQMITEAVAAGMTREEATCLAMLATSGADGTDINQVLLEISGCGLSPERLEELIDLDGGGVEITSPDSVRSAEEVEAMIRSVERKGMTRAEAECHVDAYLGVVERDGDTDVALQKLLACGLTVERMDEVGIFAGCPWRPDMCASNN